MDDNECMARVQQGNREAFELLVSRHYDASLRFARTLVTDAQLSQDAVQESFADLYAHRARYQPGFTFQTYLLAIVRHKSIDLLRRRKRSLLPLDTIPEEQLPHAAIADTPEGQCIRQAFTQGLASVIDALPPEKREMLLMYAIQNKSYRQIAEETHKSVAQVKITLHRIRAALRRTKEEWQ